MAKDLQESLAAVLGTVAQEASKNLLSSRDNRGNNSSGGGPFSGAKGVLAGAGAAAAAPIAIKGARKLIGGNGLGNILEAPGKLAEAPGKIAEAPGKLVSNIGSSVGDGIGEKVGGKLDEAGGPGGLLKDTVKGALPFGGGGDDGGKGGKGGMPGVGKGRRMPIQQSVDIGLPIETVYNQFTQFEEWPNFMHRVKSATQEDQCSVSLSVKIWTRTRDFTANIETQRPDERVKWSTSQGMTHTGVVTFHELGPNLTRVLVGFDVDPGGMIEKFARGARHIKRAARADLHRFKAFIETQETETGAWRGRIEDGEVVEEHDPSYDEGRDYSETPQPESEDEGDEQQEQDDDQEGDEEKGGREQRRGQTRSSSQRSNGKEGGSSSQSERSGGSSSRSGGSSSRSGGSSRRSSGSSGRSSGSSGRSSGSSGRSSGSSGRSGGSSGRSGGSSGRSGGSASRASGRSGSSRSGGSSSAGRSGSSRTRAASAGRSRSQRSGSNGRG